MAKLEGDGGDTGVSSRGMQPVVAMATPADLTTMTERTNLVADLAKLMRFPFADRPV